MKTMVRKLPFYRELAVVFDRYREQKMAVFLDSSMENNLGRYSVCLLYTSTFDTISTYVVNATKGSQTTIKTALWALSTVIFLVVILFVVLMNLRANTEKSERAGV